MTGADRTRQGGSSEIPAETEAAGAAGDLHVDVSGDREARVVWAVFLAGPTVWFAHFMLVYLVVEAGCTGNGHGLEVFDPPVSDVVTLVATAAAALACLASARWAYKAWRSESPVDERSGTPAAASTLQEHVRTMSFAGFLLAMLSLVAILFVGLPAPFLSGC